MQGQHWHMHGHTAADRSIARSEGVRSVGSSNAEGVEIADIQVREMVNSLDTEKLRAEDSIVPEQAEKRWALAMDQFPISVPGDCTPVLDLSWHLDFFVLVSSRWYRFSIWLTCWSTT
jgi:hypothetical protein